MASTRIMARIDEIEAGDAAIASLARSATGGTNRQGRVCIAGQRLLSDEPDRAGIRRHGRMLGARQGRVQAGGRVGDRHETMDSFFSIYVWPGLLILLQSVLLLVVLLVLIAFLLYADRKVWAAVQLRRGPNVVGPWGLLQSFADLLKFVFKEPVIPSGANKGVFLLAPLVAAVLAMATWAVIPVDYGWVIADINVGILFIFAIASLEVYGVLMGGWASNSKYPFLGALRSAAQMVSYEVSIGFVIITVLLCVGSLNLTHIVLAQETGIGTWLGLPASFLDWHWLALFPMFIVFFISALAETNRPPFDLVEAESELVAGHMIEYSSTPFLLFFLGEYVAIVLMCALTTILFLGGWLPPVDIAPFNWLPGVFWFVFKVVMVFFMFALVKSFVPRFRYDQLMRLGWKVFLPLSLFMVVATATVLKLWELLVA
jgi:NADH-quinone oxidoreductase subunit H